MSTNSVQIVSKNSLQNELFISFLVKETGLEIFSCSTLGDIPNVEEGSDSKQLILFDCMGLELDQLWTKFGIGTNLNPARTLTALFNVERGTRIEREAVERSVRGVFYLNEPLEIFSKGILSIFRGELWYSRRTVSKLLLESRSSLKSVVGAAVPLTARERQILIEIASGAPNQEIADNLFISLHTVKTHIYNIYKKIGVSNRLQATLWVAKYL